MSKPQDVAEIEYNLKLDNERVKRALTLIANDIQLLMERSDVRAHHVRALGVQLSQCIEDASRADAYRMVLGI